jgi:DNA-directed RNA polymerase specialized sigma24 family protein
VDRDARAVEKKNIFARHTPATFVDEGAMSASMPMEGPKVDAPLADPELRRFLLDFVKRRVGPADADDIVQTVFVEALAAKNLPTDREEMRKYLLGIAKHKVVDAHRRTTREEVGDPPELPVSPPPVEEEALVRWAERQAPATEEAKKTLAWMAREGEGEKLESIAAEEKVPAARVRQRVSRMRRWMKERWLAELAAVAALAVLGIVLWRVLRDPDVEEAIRPEDSAHPLPESPLDRARSLRAEALRRCDEGDYPRCVAGLDEASRLDPAGDSAPEVQAAREKARRALEPKIAPTSKFEDGKKLAPESKQAPVPQAPPTSTTRAPLPKSTNAKPTPKGKNEATPFEDFQKSSPAKKKQRKGEDAMKK